MAAALQLACLNLQPLARHAQTRHATINALQLQALVSEAGAHSTGLAKLGKQQQMCNT